MYHISCAWLVGQEVKTLPSHGRITGSIPIRASICDSPEGAVAYAPPPGEAGFSWAVLLFWLPVLGEPFLRTPYDYPFNTPVTIVTSPTVVVSVNNDKIFFSISVSLLEYMAFRMAAAGVKPKETIQDSGQRQDTP